MMAQSALKQKKTLQIYLNFYSTCDMYITSAGWLTAWHLNITHSLSILVLQPQLDLMIMICSRKAVCSSKQAAGQLARQHSSAVVVRMASNYKAAMRPVCLDIEASRPRPLHIASKSLVRSSLKEI